jgi:hypothetical protein
LELNLFGRRVFLAAGLAAIGVQPATADTLAETCIIAIRTQMAALGDGPLLLNSYLVETGPGAGDFDLTQANAAYVYDNALAGLALLAAGHRAEAARIGQALAIAQAHDRFYHDGRLRNAYQAGPMAIPAKLPGFWDAHTNSWAEDPYQVGSETGPVAWAMLLWSALGMAAPANAAGDWLDDALRAPAGYYGGFYGFEPKPQKLTWQSTEQNTDLFAAFTKLGRAEDAAHAKTFVAGMLQGGVFIAGLAPDGAPNPMLAADAGIWPYLAGLGSAAPARTAIKRLTRGAGIGFSQASKSIWLEGTAFASLAGAPAAFRATLAANLSPQGYVYATIAPALSTGLTVGPSLKPGVPPTAFNYYRRPALSTTAWAALAGISVNPLA